MQGKKYNGNTNKMLVMGYCATWDAPEGWTLERVDWTALTHVIDTFGIPDADGNISASRLNEKLLATDIIETAHRHGVKAMVSLGGAKGSCRFAEAVSPAKLKGFVGKIMKFVDDFGYDGVDIDWEFPEEKDKANFTGLMKGLYEEAKSGGRKAYDGSELTTTFFTATALEDAGVNWGEIGNYVDYAIQGGYNWLNPYNAPLRNTGKYTTKSGAVVENSIHGFAESLIKRGFPKEKLILGLPFYGRPLKIRYHNMMKEGKFLGYDEMQAEARYDYNGTVQYVNTPQSFSDKIAYVREQNRPGIAIWQITSIYPETDIWETIKRSV